MTIRHGGGSCLLWVAGEMRRGRSGDGDRLDRAVPVDPSESKDCGRGAQSNYFTTLTPPLGSVP